MEAVLVSNGPGELYTWAYPVYCRLREVAPDIKLSISLIPCQYAAGHETEIARSFGADAVTSPKEYLAFMASSKRPAALGDPSGAGKGFVLSLGGNANLALKLGSSLAYPTYSYKFVPHWNNNLAKLFVHDEPALRKARRLGAPAARVEQVGNLVADAVQQVTPAREAGTPHIFMGAGTRDGFSIFLIPFMIAVADRLGEVYPKARFVWPVSRLLSADTVRAGIAGEQRAILDGVAGRREGDAVITPNGSRIDMIAEADRYAHMRAADLAITIPGTNTLELGIAGVPSIVILPMNKPEAIPLDGAGHWLGLIPVVGKYLKRYAVKLFVEGMNVPASLPNRFSGEDLMLEIKGKVNPDLVADAAINLLDNAQELARRRARLNATMPQAGAAARLVDSVLADFGRGL